MFVTNATERVLDKRAWRDQGAFVHKREVPRRWQLSAYSASKPTAVAASGFRSQSLSASRRKSKSSRPHASSTSFHQLAASSKPMRVTVCLLFLVHAAAFNVNVATTCRRASQSPLGQTPQMNSAKAKAAWLAKQVAPAWGPNAADATDSKPTVPDTTTENAARAAWLAKQDTPSWGAKVAAEEAPAAVGPAAMPLSEDAAKAAWLAKQDKPSWGPAAAVPALPVAAVPPVSSSDEEARRAWLARQEAPSWGRKAEAVPVTASPVAPSSAPSKSEEAAKAAWLAKQEQPSWGYKAAAPSPLAPPPVPAAAARAVSQSEEAAKAAWLAKQVTPFWGRPPD